MKVLKFGGTSVANAENIKRVKKVLDSVDQPAVVVVSALGGITDMLLQASVLAATQDETYKNVYSGLEERHMTAIRELLLPAGQSPVISKVKTDLNVLETLLEGAFLIGETTPRLLDKIMSFGELLSSYIISEYLKQEGYDLQFKDSRELIKTDEVHGKVRVNQSVTVENCREYFGNLKGLVLIPGFVASSTDGQTTTLGRGGSDYTAALVAGALEAERLEIWTDVSGMFTANPKLVKQARALDQISYEEAMELSHFGAKVIYPPTIQPVLEKEIPILIKNTFEPEAPGTLITKSDTTSQTVRGISHVPGIALLSLEGPGMIGIPGISRRFFEVLSQEGISVIFITQASSEHSICVGIAETDQQRAVEVIHEAFAFEIERKKIKPVLAENKLSIIALVGDRMKSHQGLSGKMFSALGRNNVNIRAIAQGASERNISAVISEADVKKALNTLHEAFFEAQVKQLNLFIVGVGNVGSRLLAQLQQQKKYLKKELRLNVRVIGLSNSRTMVFKEDGLDLSNWEKELAAGVQADRVAFYESVKRLNYRNSIFIDNTASDAVTGMYARFLKDNVAVVTCNKIACSSDFSNYRDLKTLARQYNAPFLFETNVGAGLPILDTLKNLIASGDKVHKIQAVLSGSLNFVFNTFNDKTLFRDIVKQAQEEGYTEPDPKIDLSGIDVMRKILILARESGYELNIEDINCRSFLPEACLQTKDNDSFFTCLEKNEAHFQQIYTTAQSKNARLKYVAEFDEGKASVGLREIPPGHDFYNLEGSDNIVLFYTERYPKQPLVIKGAGAGADVTASGIFADIIRAGGNQ